MSLGILNNLLELNLLELIAFAVFLITIISLLAIVLTYTSEFLSQGLSLLYLILIGITTLTKGAVTAGIYAMNFASCIWIFYMMQEWIWSGIGSSIIEFIATKKKNKELREKEWGKSLTYTFLGLTILTMNWSTFFFASLKVDAPGFSPINGGLTLVVSVVLLARFLIERRSNELKEQDTIWKKIARNMCICAIASLMMSMSAYVLL